MKNIKSNFLQDEEIVNTLELFVSYGILIKTMKDGESSWKNSPDFDSKSEQEQKDILERIKSSDTISTEILNELNQQHGE